MKKEFWETWGGRENWTGKSLWTSPFATTPWMPPTALFRYKLKTIVMPVRALTLGLQSQPLRQSCLGREGIGTFKSRRVLKQILYRSAWKDLSEQLQQANGAETGDTMFPEQKDVLTAAILTFPGRSSTHAAKLSASGLLCVSPSRRGSGGGAKRKKAAEQEKQKTSKGSRQVALKTECISKNLCQPEDVAINHFSLGESAFTDLCFSTSGILTGFTTVAVKPTLYRNLAVEGCFYGFKKKGKSSHKIHGL